ncbi:MAG: hypothetical protein NXI02_32810 [Rhodobacteraceae bacterium]|nr:hypothetical protein [Paracoccaceae bacterium]
MTPVIHQRLRPPLLGLLITPKEPRFEQQEERVPARIGAGRL